MIKLRQDKKEKANVVTIMYKKEKGEKQTYGVYSHVKSGLKKKDIVKEGEKIGVTDESGRSTGGHVHYQKLDEKGKVVDPSPDVKSWDPYPNAKKPAPNPKPVTNTNKEE